MIIVKEILRTKIKIICFMGNNKPVVKLSLVIIINK